jgi:rhamnosyltransferase
MPSSVKTSIIVRAYNEERHIKKLLIGIQRQKVSFGYEVILVDSGSTDKTVHIASTFGVKILNIPPEDFSFAYSLNQGIEGATGEFCVFISAHCYPENEFWLENLIRPFNDPSIALVYGKQRGGESTKYSEHQIFAKWFSDDGGGKQDSAFSNNANAAIRITLWEKYKYNEGLTGLEDIDWANRIISKGYYLYYTPDAGVIHVHNETASQVFNRYKREAIAMKMINPHVTFTFYETVKLFFLNTLSDYFHAVQDRKLVHNLTCIPLMRLLQFWGTYRGHNFKRLVSSDLKQKFYYPRKHDFFKIRDRRKKKKDEKTDIYS